MPKYLIIYTFADGRKLRSLYPANDLAQAKRIAASPDVQRSIMRRRGMAQRTASAHEYTDRFPKIVSTSVVKSKY